MILHNGDCLEFMRSMEDKSVDMVFTSPPFKEEDVDGEYWEVYDSWMNEIFRVTKLVACIIHSATKLNDVISKYPPHRTMVWGKGIIMASYRWNPIHVYQMSDDYKINKYIWADSFGVESILGNWKVHKYQDPELLYETVIKMFKGCKSVLDPFMGSGTTGQVCRKLALEFIGCEVDLVNYQIAVETISGQIPNPIQSSLFEAVQP